MRKSEKTAIIEGFSEKLKATQAIIIAEYRGLKVSELTEIRKEIKKSSGSFKVIKNRLAKRSMTGTVWEPLQPHMKGPVGIASSEADPVTLAKVLTKYAESMPALKLKAGLFGGKILDVKGIEALSKLPSKEELYAKMLGTLMAPATNVVRTLQGVPQKLAMALKAISEKKQ